MKPPFTVFDVSWLRVRVPCALIGLSVCAAAAPQELFPARHWPGGPAPLDSVAADLDEDGALDVLTISASASTLSVILADGSGGFLAPTVLPAGDTPLALAAGDADGDGHIDVVVVHYDSADLRIFLGAGDGSLRSGATYVLGGAPRDVLLTDFNEDGALDIVTANEATDSIGLLRGLGDGSFGVPVDVGAGHSPFAVAAGDVDLDGHVDLATANFDFPGTLSVLRGHGDGSFEPPVLYQADVAAHAGTSRVALADMEGDGDLDLVSFSQSSPSVLSVRRNNGTGLFLAPLTVGFPSLGGAQPRFDVADLDLDGRLDVLVPVDQPLAAGLYVLRGSAVSGLEPAKFVSGGTSASAVTIADVTGDGLPDAVLAHTVEQAFSVLSGNGTLDIGQPPAAPLPDDAVTDLLVADLDRDGTQDALALTRDPLSGASTLWVLPGDGAANLLPAVGHAVGPSAVAAAVGDLDENGWLDVVVAQRASSDPLAGSVGVLLNDGSGALLAAVSYAAGPFPGAVALGDVDGDGHLDVLAGNTGAAPGLSLLLGDGSGALGSPASNATGAVGLSATPLLLQDVSGDGRPDLFLSKALRLNDGAGGFLPPVMLLSVSDVSGLALADVDGDDIPDLVAVKGGPWVLKGDGAGGFSTVFVGTSNEFAMSGRPAIADFDGDGHADIAGTSVPSGIARVAHGDGSGAFASPATFTAGHDVGFVQPADLDADGRTDLLLATTALQSKLPLLLNRAIGTWTDLGDALPGTPPPAGHGTPKLIGLGTLQPDSPLTLKILDGPSAGSASLVIGVFALDAPFKGGTLVPFPTLILPALALDGGGDLTLAATLPSLLPPGTSLWLQSWQPDAGGPAGYSATNALKAVTPQP